jgi:hypothetical protein
MPKMSKDSAPTLADFGPASPKTSWLRRSR